MEKDSLGSKAMSMKKVHTYFETTVILETMKLIKNLQRKKYCYVY